MKTKSKKISRDPSRSRGKTITNGMNTSHLMELFEEQLKDILWAEKALIKAIPRMINLATSDDLIIELTSHLQQTNEQVTRLAKVFRTIGKKPTTIKCDAMEGLIAEASEMMEDCDKGPKCDAGIIAATQKIEHYEIASYGTLRKFAETLGLRDAEKLLMETLIEEKEADLNLTNVAVVHGINMAAASSQL